MSLRTEPRMVRMQRARIPANLHHDVTAGVAAGLSVHHIPRTEPMLRRCVEACAGSVACPNVDGDVPPPPPVEGLEVEMPCPNCGAQPVVMTYRRFATMVLLCRACLHVWYQRGPQTELTAL